MGSFGSSRETSLGEAGVLEGEFSRGAAGHRGRLLSGRLGSSRETSLGEFGLLEGDFSRGAWGGLSGKPFGEAPSGRPLGETFRGGSVAEASRDGSRYFWIYDVLLDPRIRILTYIFNMKLNHA